MSGKLIPYLKNRKIKNAHIMDTKKRNVIWIAGVAIFAYCIGAWIGFPFAQLGLTAGDTGRIGRANKQQVKVSSPADIKIAEKFESDSAYRTKLISGYAMLYAQTKTTVATLESLKQKTVAVKELEKYSAPINDIIDVGIQLDTLLSNSLRGLRDLDNKKKTYDLSFHLTQALNLLQIMNTRLYGLDEFSAKANELVKSKQADSEFANLYSQFIVESDYIAAECGDNNRVHASNTGAAKVVQTAMANLLESHLPAYFTEGEGEVLVGKNMANLRESAVDLEDVIYW
jgi:hypothetical protein